MDHSDIDEHHVLGCTAAGSAVTVGILSFRLLPPAD